MTEPLEPAEGNDPFSASSGQLGAPPPPSWESPAPSESQPGSPAGPSQDAPPPLGGTWVAPGPSWGAQGSGSSQGSSPPPPDAGQRQAAWAGGPAGPGPTSYGAAYQSQNPYGAAYPSGGSAVGGQFAYGTGGGNYWARPPGPGRTGVFSTGGCWALAICGIFTLGLTWLIGIPASWTAAARLARRGAPWPFIRRMRAWGITFVILGVVALLFWGLVAIGVATSASGSSAGSPSFEHTPATQPRTLPTTTPEPIGPDVRFERVRWGSAVTIKDNVGLKNANVPLTLTASNLRYPTSASMGPGAHGNASVDLRVCAGTGTVDPSLVAVAFTLDGAANRRFGSISETPESFLSNVRAGQCQSAKLIFRVPPGGKVTGASYSPIDFNGRGVIWNRG